MKIDGWAVLLAAHIEEARGRPFEWGVHDCATWAFDVRAALTGEDAADAWRGQYKTAKGSVRVMRRLGWDSIADMAADLLGEPLPNVKLAQRGDIVLFEEALGICGGAAVFFVGPDGLQSVPLRDCEVAWRIA